ncbi:E3 ubiquitin-protein ligase TTC3 isoform X1 [Podarcis lilfordi]|uniref:RING-type E3 ubiquitin transferase n=1 Tax=Podarcis lilfordi TaxID=74358 RepID=A0AA35P2H8_9SAUR|nr:E3 ubiquitin-protein ligase TTC3 isoform X1 [Podarcis lilfordi]
MAGEQRKRNRSVACGFSCVLLGEGRAEQDVSACERAERVEVAARSKSKAAEAARKLRKDLPVCSVREDHAKWQILNLIQIFSITSRYMERMSDRVVNWPSLKASHKVRAKFGSCSSVKYRPGEICKIWCSKPVSELHKYCDMIKIYTFWPFLFAPGCKHTKKCLDSSDCEVGELNLERLYEIETLEDVTDIAKKFADVPRFINGILKIGAEIDNRIFNIYDALDWIKYADDIGILQKLEKLGNYCWPFLEVFFAEYKHLISKIILEDYNLIEAFESQNCDGCMKKSDLMKNWGNEAFAKEQFDIAAASYTKAIELWPENHILYGNRALCFIRTGQYKKALCDGKRAIILKPNWPKGHYRFCDSLYLLGEHKKALEANEKGQELCRNNPEGIKDLIQQHEKFKKQIDEMRGVKQNKHRIKKAVVQKNSTESPSVSAQESKKSDNEKKTQPDNNLGKQRHTKVAANTLTKENKDRLSDISPGLRENPGKSRSKMSDFEKTRDELNSKTDSQKCLDKQKAPCSTVRQGTITLSLKSTVEDACTSLMDQRFHNAEQSFARLLSVLDPSNLKPLKFAIVDYVVILYGYATALLGIGQPEELTKAKDHFNNIIEKYEKVRFDCLAHYGIGKVYLRQNRFSEALDQFLKSKTMISHKIMPGVLTWPTTSIVIEETRTEKFQVILQDHIEECRFPPAPHAVCRYQPCQAQKIKIYFSDPDFKGFIRVTCCEQCKVEFHVSCWKKLKAARYTDKTEKDFLRELCFTPDCSGLISNIAVFSSSGLIKCEYEDKIKSKNPPRPIVKQECTSSRTLQKKQERKRKRKLMKEDTLLSLGNFAEVLHTADSISNDDSDKGSSGGLDHKNYFAGDRVLQLITQNFEKIRRGVRDGFKLLNELFSWWVISEADHTWLSTNCVTSVEVMDQIVSSVIDKNNRVATRIFVHVLSELEEVDPRLHDLMKHLDSNGLKATKQFFAKYGTCILQLDLDFIAVLWNEKYGIKLGREFTCTSPDMIDELSLIELRCFLWLLEENRENFPSLLQYLDDYFDNMDNRYTVIRKEENATASNNTIKVKNRNRKKAKEPKSILVLSGGVGTVTREEDNIFSEESTFFMNPRDPFRIPDGLNEQVAIFEALYNNFSSGSSYQRILDNYPDPTCESLYDYFSQILEEHGPMEIDNSLLVGEYEHFPAETRKIVEDAGGLKSFLLESLRFVMIGDLIGLMKHSVMLKENADVTGAAERTKNEENFSASLPSQENSKPRLNPAAKEFQPTSYINNPYVSVSTNTPAHDTLEYMTTSHSAFSPFVPTYSLSTPVTDMMAASLPMPDASLPSALLQSHPIFLNEIQSEYQSERTLPTIPEMLDILEQSNYIYPDAFLDIDPEVISSEDGEDILVANDEVQLSALSDVCSCENNPDNIENNSKEAGCDSVTKMETNNKSVARNKPRSRMIAIQVDQELADVGINTLPFHPYETQQGDMLRMEKEHQVLQEQLKEAGEKYEQVKYRSSEEINVLEAEILQLVQENKLTRKELDWFHQDAETEMKRWQQEKKENQEGLKVGKNKIRKLTETNEGCMRNIDEKDKQYKLHLDEFIEISNKFENEKVKREELIKKRREDHQECVARAIAAEVSVLENWKDTELYKLGKIATDAETYLKYLKFMTSHSSVPQLKLQINSWESFISNTKDEIRKAERQFEERIYMVKNGAFLDSISKVEIAELQPPSVLSSVTHERPPINDPAIVMYSAAAPHLPSNLFATFSSSDDDNPLHSIVNKHMGNKISKKDSKYSLANKGLEEVPPDCRDMALSDYICLPQSPGISRRSIQDTQLQHSSQEEPAAAAAGLDHANAISRPALPQLYEDVIDELIIIFPHLTRSDIGNFIEEVQVKNRNKWSTAELLNRVTEFILDRPSKKKVLPSLGKIEAAYSTTSGGSRNQTQKLLKAPGRSVSNLSKSKLANEKTKKTTLPPPSSHAPWKTVGETSKSKWKKSSDAADNDPCVICHDELTTEMLHVLDCGHRFHKVCIGPWIKEHSTCPTCRRHVLLPEDYPELPGRNRTT